jgi:Protein of unknown function DUF115
MKLRIIKLIDIISNLKWDFIFNCKILFQKDFRRTIKLNKKFKNIHYGKRCFIVGNGPSLNKLDLTRLYNEIVFTVNNIMSNENLYKTLNSDYHVLIDPTFLTLNPDLPEDRASIDLLKQINHENKKPVCIVRDDAKDIFNKIGIAKDLDLHYIFQHRNLTDKYASEMSMCKNMPTAQNVIQSAIYSAIYMGIKKIYLIGVDMTSFFNTYEADDSGGPKILKNSHAHDYSDEEIHTMLTRNKLDNEFMMYDAAKSFTIYKLIKKYCERKGIEISNATKGGGLDVYDRVPYESLF